ncbi:MAG: DUF4321 domain-containing protein [Acidaminobacteraceae bacterium]
MRINNNKSFFVLIIVILIGLVLGGVIGELFKDYIKVLSYGETIGFSPVTIDLAIVELTIGFVMRINLSSIIGIVIALLLFKELS